MGVNERIARALGWERWREAHPEIDWDSMPDYSPGWGWASPEGKRHATLPDYAHSLDACLPVLADLREKGWRFVLTDKLDGESWCCHGGRTKGFFAGMERGR